MTSSLKDVKSADMVRTLAEMNYYKKDCTVFGYSWVNHEGKRMYRMSENETMIFHAFDVDLLEHYSMTPVQKFITRELITEENQEELYFLQKLKLAQKMREEFDAQYFDCLRIMQEYAPDEQAVSLLEDWQEEIDGYFDEDELQLFEGAVGDAYIAKHLPKWKYDKMQIWIKQVRKQMSGRLQQNDAYERIFYGFAYKKAGEDHYSYIYNANKTALCNQIKELDEQRIWHTPVYHRRYWYNRSTELPSIRKQFVADMKELMNGTYLNRMEKLQNLPSAIPQDLWNEEAAKLKKNCSEAAWTGAKYWASRWNIKISE